MRMAAAWGAAILGASALIITYVLVVALVLP